MKEILIKTSNIGLANLKNLRLALAILTKILCPLASILFDNAIILSNSNKVDILTKANPLGRPVVLSMGITTFETLPDLQNSSYNCFFCISSCLVDFRI